MDFTDLQMTFTVVLVLTAAAVAVFIDQRRKQQRQHARAERIKPHSHSSGPRPIRIFERSALEINAPRDTAMRRDTAVPKDIATPKDSAPPKKMGSEQPLESLVATATPSRPPVQMRERETVTVKMAPPSPAAPKSGMELQPNGLMLPEFTIDAALWERLIGSRPQQPLLTRTETPEEAKVEPTPAPTPGTIQDDGPDMSSFRQPRGMIQQPELEAMIESKRLFSGLVVSIGINDSDSGMWHKSGLMHSVGSYIASLLRENDVSCRTSYDEFVMVCPGEQGAQSQRRLNYISERLWDYQLRGITSCSIMFSWGGVQVQNQPLAEAIASATDRMRETKRSGKAAYAHRTAV